MKILIVRIGALGDVLHALPAVAALRAAQPNAEIDWAVDPRWQPLLVNSDGLGPVVSRTFLADTKLWTRAPASLATLRSIRQLRRQLRERQYDIAIDMQGTLRSALVARMSRAAVRVGYADPRERQAAWFYTRKLPRTAAHVVEQGTELITQAFTQNSGAPDPDSQTGDAPATSIELPHEEWADTWAAEEARGGPLALLAPGAGWGAKQWPSANFSALARELRARGLDVAVAAPREDNELANRVVAESHGAARLLVSNVAGLIAITRRATLLIGGDSGPTHLAAALGVPLVALFGPTDPARNGPWGSGPKRILRDSASVTSYKHVATPDPGLASIPVAEVLQASIDVTA